MIANKIIIFDFLRTVYDPEKLEFLEDAVLVLEKLKTKNILILYTSREGDANREKNLEKLNLKKYFNQIVLVDKKKQEDLIKIFNQFNLAKEDILVVGDRIKSEIRLGNQTGFKTVWLKKGKYSTEEPEIKKEKPNFCIYGLKELLKLSL